MTQDKTQTVGKSLRSAGLIGALALSGFFFAATAEAGRGHHRGHGAHGHGDYMSRHTAYRPAAQIHDRHVRHDRAYRYHHARFVVPSHIERRYQPRYRDYRYGRTYFRPHRHHHEVYHFPVWTGAGYAYRPHDYCEGRLFVGGGFSVSGRNFSLSVGF